MTTGSGYFLQTDCGTIGNFEMIVPSPQGGFGNLELIARTGNRFDHYFREASPGAWSGPGATA